MNCQSCGSDNRDGRRFCAKCGAALPAACAACGFVNQADDAFCGGCGAAMAAAPATSTPAAPAPRPAAETSHAERRQLTVMFCDLVGSTALSERLDPEELRDVIGAYQEACAAAIGRFEGYIARYMGDGLLVYFGYPQAHEDDAERAVRAGLGIVEAVAGLHPRDDLTLEVRIGIATGLVVAGDIIGEGASEERAVLGETPNLAARLQGEAEPDTVVIVDATRRLVDGLFICEALGARPLKGISEPVALFRVLRASDASSRFEATARRGLLKLVGREEEIGLLLKRWSQARDGEGQVVLLSGEAGLGKSRIAHGLGERLEGETMGRVLYHASAYHRNSALHPVIEQLGRQFGFDAADGPPERLDKIEASLGGLGLPVAEVAPLLASLLSLPAGGRYAPLTLESQELKKRVLDVVCRVIEARTKQAPVLMVVEDVHWVDPSTLELLGLMVDRARDLPILLLMAFRPEFEPPWPGRTHVTALAINRLSRRESAAVIDVLAGGKSLPQAVLDEIVAKSDGVPLFVEEITKTVLESDLLDEGADAYSLPGALPALAIPSSLQDSLMARLDRLAPVKEVAQLAATLGRTFGHDLLAAVAARPPGELEGALAELVEAGLIHRHGQAPDVTYEFKHALVQDAAYQSLLKMDRQRHHAAIAEALEARFPDTVETHPEVLAHHLTEGGLTDPAVECWRRAGGRAAGQGANAEAINHFAKALELLATLADDAGRAPREIALSIALVASMRIVERLDDALDVLAAAEDTATRYGLGGELSRIHYFRGSLLFPTGDVEGCLREHEQARELARAAASPEDEARALSGLGDAYYLRGRMATAETHFDACVGLCRENGYRAIEVANLSMRGHMRLYLNDLSAARDDCRSAAAAAAELGNHRAEIVARGSCLAKVLFDMSDFDAARHELQTGLDLARRLGARRYEPMYMSFLGKILAIEGAAARARALLEEAVAIARDTGIGYAGPMALGALALVTDDAGGRDEALAEGTALLREPRPSHNYLWFYRDAMEACLGAADWEGVERHARALDEYTAAEPLPWSNFFMARGRALADHGRGAPDQETIAELRRLGAGAGLNAALPGLAEAV